MKRISEAETRKQLIDSALGRAGWNVKNHAQVGLEILVDGYDPQSLSPLYSNSIKFACQPALDIPSPNYLVA